VNFLLDTNILVNHLRGKKAIDLFWLEKGSSVSIITQAELFYGAYKSNKPKNNLNKIKQMFDDLPIEIITLNQKIISLYGKIKAGLEKKGKKLDEFDLLIAATSLSEDLKLVTNNIKHFQRIPRLKLVKA